MKVYVKFLSQIAQRWRRRLFLYCHIKAYNFHIEQFHYFKLQDHNIEGPKNKQFYFWGVASFHDNDTGVPDKKKRVLLQRQLLLFVNQ